MLSVAENERPSLVLASMSPRRRELLERLDLAFSIEPADIDETPRPDEHARDLVRRLAVGKAARIARSGSLVIAADTEVALEGRSLGKPVDAADAADMLRRLSGRDHVVITGVAVAFDGQVESRVSEAAVSVRELTEADIEWYVGTGEPMGKAGAYAIQGKGSLLIDMNRGNYETIVGLPLIVVDELVTQFGHCLRDWAVR